MKPTPPRGQGPGQDPFASVLLVKVFTSYAIYQALKFPNLRVVIRD